MDRKTYRIPEPNIADLRARINKLNKRADKLGCPAIEYREVGIEEVIVDEQMQITADDGMHAPEYAPTGRKITKRYHIVEVEGSAPVLPGWRFVATLQHTEAGTILRSLDDTVDLTAYRTAGPACDHCRKNIRRRDTYVVADESGKLAQIGRSCLKDFTGHADPERLAEYAQVIAEALGDMGDFETERGSWGDSGVTILDFLTWAAASIRARGWIARSAVGSGEPTANSAWECATNPRATRPGQAYDDIAIDETQDATFAAEAIAWAQDLDPGTEDYLWNLQVCARREIIDQRAAGIAASMLRAYDRDRAKFIERERRATVATPAPEGKAVVTGTILRADYRDGDWGPSVKATVLLDDGNRIYTTVPASIMALVGPYEHMPIATIHDLANRRIEITATFRRSDDDEHFAFATRPKGRLLEQEVANG